MNEFVDKRQETKLDEWKDIKIFRDPVHQYIEIPKVYVKYLIDTSYMQRIKDVAQSGLRSVYNAATHDRFSHSLGVYHLGKKAFASLKTNLLNIIEKESYRNKSGTSTPLNKMLGQDFLGELDRWEVLFHVACILHDIGHPAMSHTLEFLYDDIYMALDENCKCSINVSLEEYERYQKQRELFKKGEVKANLQIKLGEKLLGNAEANLHGSPHERMSAYYILAGLDQMKDGKESQSLVSNIRKVLESYCVHCNCEFDSEEFHKDIKFICRMIIGQMYSIDTPCIQDNVRNSIRNAIIFLLNGKIDADSLDYIARNSYSAGYDTNSVDVNRLCTAYSVRFQNNLFVSVFEKNALSVLEGFISARNFEPRWLYSHHKIVYNIDVLYKSLYKCAVDLLYMEDFDKWVEIIKANFYKIGSPMQEDDFYNKYIKSKDCEDPQEVVFSRKDQINITKNLTKILFKENIEENFYKILSDPHYDSQIRQKALLITNWFSTDGSEDVLDKLISSYDGWLGQKQYIMTYVKTRKEINEMLSQIFKELPDFLDSDFKKIILQTRQYLKVLGNDNAGEEDVYKQIEEEKEDFFAFINALQNRYAELVDVKNLYFSYILSPFKSFDNGRYFFFRSNDSDVNALFKTLYYRIKAKQNNKLNLTEKTFLNLAMEYFRRTYKQSLWKSYQEYKIFLDEIGAEIHMDASVVNEYFLELIRSGGKKIVLHDDSLGRISDAYDEQVIFRCYNQKEVKNSTFPRRGQFREMFVELEDIDFVIKIHSVKYKDFKDSVKIAFKEKVFPLGEVLDTVDLKIIEFPYIFLKLDETEETKTDGKTRRNYLKNLQEKLKSYCVSEAQTKFITKREAVDYNMAYSGGKLFRDVVHGDIVVPREFLMLIETEAFQRLRRIKQLSTADLVFPNATHTRFSHCIGTFHIMTLIVDHFKGIFKNLGVAYQQEDIDALLVAALLHDIGHGPYSHNFERLPGNKKTHEEWSADIIKNDEEILAALQQGFPQYDTHEFIKLIISYIDEDSVINNKQLSFRVIFKSLISSQLDADRFDYLLRDSYNTGIGYGNIDVNSIIRAMQVTEYRNQFYVCISEDAISYIEQFLFGRYKMYDSVYYNAYKVFSEALILNILTYIRDKADPDMLDENISALLNNHLQLEKYLKLDDSYINGLFSKWQNSEDAVLAEMCRALLHRRGYERLYIMNQTKEDLYNFRQELKGIFQDYFRDIIRIDSLNSFIFAERNFTAYKYISAASTESEPANYDSKIWILTNDGLLKDFVEVSPMFSAEKKEKTWATYKNFVYYNKKLLKDELEKADMSVESREKIPEFLVHVDQLIMNFNLRNHIEIEEKYTCTEEELQKVEEELDKGRHEQSRFRDYIISDVKKISQTDVYYDTDEGDLAKQDCSLRIRSKKGGQQKITIKAPTPNGGFDKESQVARFEYEKGIPGDQLADACDFIRSTLKGVMPNKVTDLTKANIEKVFIPKIVVNNARSKYLIQSAREEGRFAFSVCLDRVSFQHGEESKEDYQIEVELESDYIHRVSMKFFTEKIEELLIKPVQHEKYSKYKKGLKAFGLFCEEEGSIDSLV